MVSRGLLLLFGKRVWEKNENIKKNFNKSLSKLIPISGTIGSKQLKFPLKVETFKQDNLLTFINNSKIVYKKKKKFIFFNWQ